MNSYSNGIRKFTQYCTGKNVLTIAWNYTWEFHPPRPFLHVSGKKEVSFPVNRVADKMMMASFSVCCKHNTLHRISRKYCSNVNIQCMFRHGDCQSMVLLIQYVLKKLNSVWSLLYFKNDFFLLHFRRMMWVKDCIFPWRWIQLHKIR